MPTSKVAMIIQARMGSTRLPGKVLADLIGEPLLAHLIRRVLPSRYVDQFIVATTRLPSDDPIEEIANKLGVSCYRGAENDCLDRYYQAAKWAKADIVVRQTGDDPLVDFDFVDWEIEQYLSANPPCDYVRVNNFPYGLIVEVFSFNALATAWREDTSHWRNEYVTAYIYHHPKRFRLLYLESPYDYSQMRWTVDTIEDLEFMRHIFNHFGHSYFSWREVLTFVEQNLSLGVHNQQETQ